MREVIGGGIVSPSEHLQDELLRMRQELESRVNDFMSHNSLRYIVALIGDSDTTAEVVRRNQYILEDFFDALPERHTYAIQTGGTKDGIPEYGIALARSYDVPTIGVYPAAADKYALHLPDHPPADLVIQTPDLVYGRTSFGSETPIFTNLIDGAVVLGGGYGTRAEISTILRVNKSRLRTVRSYIASHTELPARDPRAGGPELPIFLCPIAPTGKAAEELTSSRRLEDVGSSLPSVVIQDGSHAARFIHDSLTAATHDIRSVL